MATGSVTPSITQGDQSQLASPIAGITKYAFAWTSDASGNVVWTSTIPVVGILIRRVIVPGTGGNQPTSYAATFKDENGIDILNGSGSALSTTVTSDQCDSIAISDTVNTGTIPRSLSDLLTLNISGAGNAKQGKIILYVKFP